MPPAVRVHVSLPSDSLARTWLERAGASLVEGDAEVLVFDPRLEAGPEDDGPRLAVLPLADSYSYLVHPEGDSMMTIRADAYAGDEVGLGQALAYLAGPRSDPRAGPLRLTYLGGLGTVRAKAEPGDSVIMDQRRSLGRGKSCDLVLRQGGHSDQNIVARIHAIVEPCEGGVLVRDARSTNGTWIDGHRIEDSEPELLTPGAELAVAGCLRVRLDGIR